MVLCSFSIFLEDELPGQPKTTDRKHPRGLSASAASACDQPLAREEMLSLSSRDCSHRVRQGTMVPSKASGNERGRTRDLWGPRLALRWAEEKLRRSYGYQSEMYSTPGDLFEEKGDRDKDHGTAGQQGQAGWPGDGTENEHTNGRPPKERDAEGNCLTHLATGATGLGSNEDGGLDVSEEKRLREVFVDGVLGRLLAIANHVGNGSADAALCIDIRDCVADLREELS
ncbi:hypothetical protein CSUI_006198 [Cystoisospora suis]|uniref:Uncharacterized protein n=1 Tax=Cystoisospora suis TaxID=483139 RepID=A0A2C6K1X2_9APIC|nr:hypothetical protein CSUI_006198 [Cystoisospora suis]